MMNDAIRHKLASIQMTNTSVKTRLCTFPPLSGMVQTVQEEAIARAPTSSYPPALGPQVHFQYGKHQMPHMLISLQLKHL